ncbi:MAG: hypothetical protein SVU32_04655, partial [Candidatus Nanohaloarchaea archaeon]|nr:hypothetical protein [Candidatus Nanohaloarchaea archaeon]
MSHLSTIISRIEREIKRFDDPMAEGMMEKHVRNLREYPELWDDATDEELERRQELLEQKPWQAEVVYVVDCGKEDCDWFAERDTYEKATEAQQSHYYGSSG